VSSDGDHCSKPTTAACRTSFKIAALLRNVKYNVCTATSARSAMVSMVVTVYPDAQKVSYAACSMRRRVASALSRLDKGAADRFCLAPVDFTVLTL
jgi:hypothetical protein